MIFFTALQFSYNEKFNIKLFNKLIDNNYEVHFAREDLSFAKDKINNDSLDFLITNSMIFKRDEKELLDFI